MSIPFLPDQILEEAEIRKFVELANTNAKKIVGDSKFVIPPPELPGAGLLISLWIKQAEKSLGAYFVPFLAVKGVLDAPTQIKPALDSIKGFIDNPLQALLDTAVNTQLQSKFFIPLRVVLLSSGEGKPSTGLSNLSSLVARANSESIVSGSTGGSEGVKYPYVFSGVGVSPGEGQYSIDSSSSNSSTIISVSSKDNNGESLEIELSSLIPGDFISLDNDGVVQEWIIDGIAKNSNFYTLNLVPRNEPENQKEFAVTEKTVYVQTTQNPATKGKKALRDLFIGPDGKIKFPIVIGAKDLLEIVGVPSVPPPLSLLSLRIGDFNDLLPGSPLRLKIQELEAASGWNFQKDVLEKVFQGKYPKVIPGPTGATGSPEIQGLLPQLGLTGTEGAGATGADNSGSSGTGQTSQEKVSKKKQKARNELLAIAKLYLMIVEETPVFLYIFSSYIKLLLLPVIIVFSTLTSLFTEALTKPVEIIKLLVKVFTDPMELLATVIAKAVLQAIRPNIEPALNAANIKWEEVTLSIEGGKKKGLEPLIVDILLNRFKCKDKKVGEKDGEYNSSIQVTSETGSFSELGGTGGTAGSGESSPTFTNFSYDFIYDGGAPAPGIVSLNNEDLDKVTSIKINFLDSNVNSTVPSLAIMETGSEISVPKDGNVWIYVVKNKTVPPGNSSYIDFGVELKFSPTKSNLESDVTSNFTQSFINPRNSAILSPGANLNNVKLQSPGNDFLQCLISEYLPIRVIAVWESVRGFLGVVLGLVSAFPVLIPALVTQLFKGDDNLSKPIGPILINLANKKSTEINTEKNPLDFSTIRGSEDTRGLVDALIGEKGIDTVLLEQAKKDPTLRARTINESGNLLSVKDFGKNLKILLALGRKYSDSGNLTGETIIVPLGSEKITVRLTTEEVNRYRISRDGYDGKGDFIIFIRDNLYVARTRLARLI